MHTDRFPVIFDFKRHIFKRKKLNEDVDGGSQTISRFRSSLFTLTMKRPVLAENSGQWSQKLTDYSAVIFNLEPDIFKRKIFPPSSSL
jgi:hypothetical protein